MHRLGRCKIQQRAQVTQYDVTHQVQPSAYLLDFRMSAVLLLERSTIGPRGCTSASRALAQRCTAYRLSCFQFEHALLHSLAALFE